MSIRDNIKLANPNLNDQDIWNLLHICEIAIEIEALPEKLDTLVGEKGVNFSGGQKQRLALARGLAANPSLLLLDDPLSAIDIHTEEKIVGNLSKLPLTIILVSHRLNVLKNCQYLIVLNGNTIEASGSHTELSRSSATFQKLANLQGQS
jgi:ATP-binding cassette subfamily B protein